jgi:hypothetical protein
VNLPFDAGVEQQPQPIVGKVPEAVADATELLGDEVLAGLQRVSDPSRRSLFSVKLFVGQSGF